VIEHATADIVANADDCQESDLNEMTMDWEKEKPGKISGRVGQFSRAETGQFRRALKHEDANRGRTLFPKRPAVPHAARFNRFSTLFHPVGVLI